MCMRARARVKVKDREDASSSSSSMFDFSHVRRGHFAAAAPAVSYPLGVSANIKLQTRFSWIVRRCPSGTARSLKNAND